MRKSGDDDFNNMTDYEIYEVDSSDRFARTDRELKAMENFVEVCPLPVDMMECTGNLELGLELNFQGKSESISESGENVDKPMASYPPPSPQTYQHSPDLGVANSPTQPGVGREIHRASDLLMSVSVCADINKSKIFDLAVAAMEELTKMALEGEPLWQLDVDGETEILNDAEYVRKFVPLDATLEEIIRMVEVGETLCLPNLDDTMDCLSKGKYKPTLPMELGLIKSFRTEASRETGFVIINPINLVEMLMDVDKWSTLCSNIVSRAMILGVLSTGEPGSHNGALQVMTAEFHVPSPLVPTRESQFARYCRKLTHQTWGVVDVSLEDLFPNPLLRCRRRPSGCLIQEMPNGYSKVIWVEHVEVDNRSVHNLFKPLVMSGLAFNAIRWVATLVRLCEPFSTVTASCAPAHDRALLISQAGKTSVLKLAERLTRSYYAGVSASSGNSWMPLPLVGAQDIMVMTRNNIDDQGKPPGTAITVATSFLLPAPPKKVFNFLCDENSRDKWDILSNGCVIQEVAHICIGHDSRNRVSILKVNAARNQIDTLFLQVSYSDLTGAYVIYAPIDLIAMSMVLNGGNSDYVAILPSGFAILPPDRQTMHGEEIAGSLLTVAFQILDSSSTVKNIPSESVDTIYHLITQTIGMLKAAVVWNDP